MSNRHLDPSWMFSRKGIKDYFEALLSAELERHYAADAALREQRDQMIAALKKTDLEGKAS